MTNQEVIEILSNLNKQVTVKSDGAYQTNCGKDACKIAIKCIQNDIQNNWIPCKERLPEVDKEVEVRLSNGIEFQGFYDGYKWNIGDSNLMYLAIDLVDAFEDEELKVLSWRNKR